jgi:hypothetical protein
MFDFVLSDFPEIANNGDLLVVLYVTHRHTHTQFTVTYVLIIINIVFLRFNKFLNSCSST